MNKKQVEEQIKVARKTANKNAQMVYGDLLSRIGNLEIARNSAEEISEADIGKIIVKMIGERTESLKSFTDNDRTNLVEIEKAELDILKPLAPKTLGREETENIVNKVLADNSITAKKEMGKAMKALKDLKIDIDFKLVSVILNQKLT
jgi:uncharacterized protein YqeY